MATSDVLGVPDFDDEPSSPPGDVNSIPRDEKPKVAHHCEIDWSRNPGDNVPGLPEGEDVVNRRPGDVQSIPRDGVPKTLEKSDVKWSRTLKDEAEFDWAVGRPNKLMAIPCLGDSEWNFERPENARWKKDEPEFCWSQARPKASTTVPTEEGAPLERSGNFPGELSERPEEDEDTRPNPVTGVPCAEWMMLALGAVVAGLGAATPASEAGPAVSTSLLKVTNPSPTDEFYPNPNDLVHCSQDPNCAIVMDGLGPVITPGTLALFDIPGTCQSKSRDWLRVGKDIMEFKPERIRQRFAFSMLFCETDGGRWLENDMWLSDLHECDWYNKIGVDPCNRYEEIEILRINDNHVQGTLPAELSILSTLYEFTASDNLVTGTIPEEYAVLSNLDTLCLAFNLFEGPIPGFIFRFPDLVQLDLAFNKFTGSIPSDIAARMPNLEFLLMENNEISGPIPDNLGELHLRRLHMDDNQLTGTIPSSLGNAPQLEQLYLHNNNLQGTIPGELINNKELMFATIHGNPKMTMDNVDTLNEVCKELAYSGAGQLTGFSVDCVNIIPCDCCECATL